jgi:hypothetical protein
VLEDLARAPLRAAQELARAPLRAAEELARAGVRPEQREAEELARAHLRPEQRDAEGLARALRKCELSPELLEGVRRAADELAITSSQGSPLLQQLF